MKVVGHRGARGLAPENTLVSLQKAVQHGVDEVEFDLRVTKDNVVVLHHDSALTLADGKQYSIAHYSYVELKARKPDLATFKEALEVLGKDIGLYVEVKPSEPTSPIVAIIKSYLSKGWQAKRIQLASFSQKVLLDLHAKLPEIEKIILEPRYTLRATFRARQVGSKCLSMNHRWLWKGLIRYMSRRGWKIYTYTLNDPVKAKRWQQAGLAAVITDYPDRFQKRPL